MKLAPAWKPDEWVCHHSRSRQSTNIDDYYHRQSKVKSATTSRHFDSSSSPKRVSTARIRQQIENLSLKSAEYRRSAGKSKVKRLTDSLSPKSYKSFLSYASHHHRLLTPPIRIPKMSKQSLKRWLDARDAYLGHNYPYMIERRLRRRHRRRRKSSKEADKMIDYEEAISIFSLDSGRFTVPELISSGQKRRLSRKDSHTKPISHSETNLRRSGSLLQRIKSFVQSPVSPLSCLSLRKQQRKKTQIIHDNFDDKCVGTEISERRIFQTNIERNDQCIQVNLPRPQMELHYEYDTSMVDGEKKQRTRSARRYVEYSDKATETDFILNFANVEKERRGEEKEVNEDDKATRRDIEKEKLDPYTEQYNVQQPSMSDTNQRKAKKNQSIQSPKLTNTGNRIVPLTDLFQTSINNEHENNDKQNGSRLTILTQTESNISVHEQLHR